LLCDALSTLAQADAESIRNERDDLQSRLDSFELPSDHEPDHTSTSATDAKSIPDQPNENARVQRLWELEATVASLRAERDELSHRLIQQHNDTHDNALLSDAKVQAELDSHLAKDPSLKVIDDGDTHGNDVSKNVADLRKELASWQLHAHSLESQLNSTRSELERHTSSDNELAEARAQIESTKERAKELELELSAERRVRSEDYDMREDLHSAQQRVSQLEHEKAERERELHAVREEVGQLRDDKKRKQQQQEKEDQPEAKGMLQQLDQERQRNAEKLQELSVANGELSSALEEERNRTSARSSGSEVDGQIEFERKLQEVQNELEQERSNAQGLANELKQEQNKALQLQDDIERQSAEREAQKECAEAEKLRRQEAEDECHKLNARIKEETENCQNAEEERDEAQRLLHDERSTHSEQLNQKAQHCDSMERERNEAQQQLEESRERLKLAEREKNALENELDAEKATVQRKSDEASAERDRALSMHTEEELEEARAESRRIAAERDDVTKRLERQQELVSSLREESARLKGELTEVQSASKASDGELKRLQGVERGVKQLVSKFVPKGTNMDAAASSTLSRAEITPIEQLESLMRQQTADLERSIKQAEHWKSVHQTAHAKVREAQGALERMEADCKQSRLETKRERERAEQAESMVYQLQASAGSQQKAEYLDRYARDLEKAVQRLARVAPTAQNALPQQAAAAEGLPRLAPH
jgi:chromosome segregation ATPase